MSIGRRHHLKLTTQFYPTQFIKFEEATIETDHTSKQGLYDVIQSFKDKVRTEGKSFYRLNVRINSEDIIAFTRFNSIKRNDY